MAPISQPARRAVELPRRRRSRCSRERSGSSAGQPCIPDRALPRRSAERLPDDGPFGSWDTRRGASSSEGPLVLFRPSRIPGQAPARMMSRRACCRRTGSSRARSSTRSRTRSGTRIRQGCSSLHPLAALHRETARLRLVLVRTCTWRRRTAGFLLPSSGPRPC